MNKYLPIVLAFALLFGIPELRMAAAGEGLTIGDICRLKGQEENTIQGLGLVVGLNGTGDEAMAPTNRALGRMLQLLGANIGSDAQGLPDLKEIESTANVAIAIVTATIPAAGAQQGDQLDCTVSSLNSKDLTGGNLMITYMRGPRADVDRVFALCQGPITVSSVDLPTTGKVYKGCKMESSIKNAFAFDNMITLILDKDLASFSTAVDIADSINISPYARSSGDSGLSYARAIDQVHVEVTIPPQYRNDPILFIPLIEQIPINNIQRPKRVVLSEKDGVVVIGEDVLINPVVVSHKNMSIEAVASSFVGLDPASPKQPRPKLKNLVDALNALKVPTQDVIAIIRNLDRNGDLYGTVILN